MKTYLSRCCTSCMVITLAMAAAATAQTQPATAAAQTAFKFDFGPGELRAEYTRVRAGEMYSVEKGYGFDFDSKVADVVRPGMTSMHGGPITTDQPPFFFSVKVPEGNYRITVTLGGAAAESRLTIRTEAGHLMGTDIVVPVGQTVKRTFIANVRRPELPPPPRNAPGGSIVHMFLAGEAESRCWDEKLTIEFNGINPSVSEIEIAKADDVPTIFVAGDSTVGDPRRGPAGNWPTQMCQFFKPTVAVCNSAEGGETSKSFVTGQRMDKVLSQMKAGDFFLVQFAHNDSKQQWPQTYTEPATTFKAYLNVFLMETRRRGATLVLVTPMERRANEDSVGPWARAMREFSQEQNVPLIDQWAMSKQLWTTMGPNVNQAFSDQTHLSGYGGYLLSKVVVAGIKKSVPELAKHVVDDFQELDLQNPPPPPAYISQSPAPGSPARGGRGGRGARGPATAPGTGN